MKPKPCATCDSNEHMTGEHARLNRAEYAADRRVKAKAQGRCIQCFVRDVCPESRSRCEKCLENRRTYQRAFNRAHASRKGQNKCHECGELGHNSATCGGRGRPRIVDHVESGPPRQFFRPVTWCMGCLMGNGHRLECPIGGIGVDLRIDVRRKRAA